ncbi:MAG: hypothetical protein EBU26_15375, partial [Verrucomicrobia bacterium]|nr:hypothetical protein [Verrucomicrobiota bacterium]
DDHNRDCGSFHHGFAAVSHDLPAGNQGHSENDVGMRSRGFGLKLPISSHSGLGPDGSDLKSKLLDHASPGDVLRR